MVYSRGVVLTHEVNVRDRRQVASRDRTAQLCRRLPQDLGRVPLVLGYSFVLNFFFICECVERESAYAHGSGRRRQERRGGVGFETRASAFFGSFSLGHGDRKTQSAAQLRACLRVTKKNIKKTRGVDCFDVHN